MIGLGHEFRRTTDTEVILDGYEQWGDGVIDHVVERHFAGQEKGADAIWELLLLELWFRMWVDQPSQNMPSPEKGPGGAEHAPHHRPA